MTKTACLVLLLVLAAPLLGGCLGPGMDEAPGRHHAVVVAAHPLAAEAGAAVLRAGGNAIDAAAAVQFALNVVEPHMSGIGGGGFLLYHEAESGAMHAWDGRETAPAAVTPEMFLDALGEPMPMRDAMVSGKAVGVPGTVALWTKALAAWGSMDLAEVVAPAVALAREGFPVYGHLEDYIVANEWKLTSWPASAEVFFPGSVCVPTQAGFDATHQTVPRCVGGAPLREGDLLVQPDLARTLERLGKEGDPYLYGGEAGAAIVAAAGERDGRITLEDLRGYHVVEREPVLFHWAGHDVATMPAPGGGVPMAQILGIVEATGQGWDRESADAWHVLIEATRLAFADRALYMADPDFVDVPEAGLLDPDYLQKRTERIRMQEARSHPAGDPWRSEEGSDPEREEARGWDRAEVVPDAGHLGHTTHFSVVDHDGNIASVTSTIEQVFGTGILVPGYGFFLNNQLTDFDFEPGGANEVAPDKRPRSSMSPTIVLSDGRPVLQAGGPGGATIITSVAQVVLNSVAAGNPLDEAIAAPRVYAPGHPGVSWESGLPVTLRDALEARGHEFPASPSRFGSVQGLERLADDSWSGVADTRSAPGGVVEVPFGVG